MTPAQYSKAQRRLLTTLGGLGVAALAAGTFVLSYDDLRRLALRGGAARHWAYLYPGMVDALVVVIILSILSVRRSGWFSRAVRWLLLVVLVAGAGAAGIQRAVKGYEVLPDTPVNVGVAVAPWAILIIAVWLWVAMFKQVLSRRTRRSRDDEPEVPGAGAPEPVPATVVDGSIVPGLDGETRTLPRPGSVRELGPVREPLGEPARSEPEENPWEAARLKPEPGEDDTEPVPAGHETAPPAAWDELSAAESPEAVRRSEETAGAEPARHPEPSDPVPASWRGAETDDDTGSGGPATGAWSLGDHAKDAELAATDTQPNPVTGDAETPGAEPSRRVPPSWGGKSAPEDEAEAGDDEPAPLLAPTPRRPELNADTTTEHAVSPAGPPEEATTEPEPEVEAPVNDKPSPPEEPRPRYVARTSLPTDVRLVGGPKKPLADTQPDGIKLPDTQPDGIPIMTAAAEDDEDDAYPDERAEDPDAGMEATPPSSKFRSGPMPPRG